MSSTNRCLRFIVPRDVTANVAILSGDLAQDDGKMGNAENAYIVVTSMAT